MCTGQWPDRLYNSNFIARHQSRRQPIFCATDANKGGKSYFPTASKINEFEYSGVIGLLYASDIIYIKNRRCPHGCITYGPGHLIGFLMSVRAVSNFPTTINYWICHGVRHSSSSHLPIPRRVTPSIFNNFNSTNIRDRIPISDNRAVSWFYCF